MTNKIFQIILIIAVACMSNVLDMYETYEKDDSLTIPEILPVYTGPLYVTGGAFDQYYTAECAPTQLGKVLSNSILINADSGAYDTFSFENIEYYKVTDKANPDTFYVMHMNSKLHDKDFEIIVELREGPHYNRVIYLFEEGQRYMMLFWKNKIHVTTPSTQNEI